MPSASHDTTPIKDALKKLDPLEPNRYIIALGPVDEQFIGSPNGYRATYIPQSFLSKISAGTVKRITWASYGCNPESFFFGYQLQDREYTFDIGPRVPQALQSFVDDMDGIEDFQSRLRVHFGANESFAAWSRTNWICSNLPPQLVHQLCQWSSDSSAANGITEGVLKRDTLNNVQWHARGSYYAKAGNRFASNCEPGRIQDAWNDMWKNRSKDDLQRIVGTELAYFFISPYSNEGDTFALIKQQSSGHDPPFIVHFEGEPVHSNLDLEHTSTVEHASSSSSDTDSSPDSMPSSNSVAGHDGTGPDQQVQPTTAEKEEAAPGRWATSKKTGRPHPLEERELNLKKGERVTVIADMGRDWCMGVNAKGVQGYIHGSWLHFDDRKVHRDEKAAAYLQFRDDMERLFVPGELHGFPVMTDYVNTCDKLDCEQRKEDPSSPGICIHDLGALLSASGNYSYEWLKDGRNIWHPDRFARFCQPGQAERLKPMTECMFVMYGKLMDKFRT